VLSSETPLLSTPLSLAITSGYFFSPSKHHSLLPSTVIASFQQIQVVSKSTSNQPLIIFAKTILVRTGEQDEGQCLAWHAVASWTWDAQDETCGICRMAFDGCCPDCKLPGDDCPLIWGACNHAFHLHCILKWVNSQTSQAHCPMCRREWQFKG
ncbi:hypothetical protein G4B88_008440, partial [Cannabis sativa]